MVVVVVVVVMVVVVVVVVVVVMVVVVVVIVVVVEVVVVVVVVVLVVDEVMAELIDKEGRQSGPKKIKNVTKVSKINFTFCLPSPWAVFGVLQHPLLARAGIHL